jgi:nucleotide-binding universal stress UspA family protein
MCQAGELSVDLIVIAKRATQSFVRQRGSVTERVIEYVLCLALAVR